MRIVVAIPTFNAAWCIEDCLAGLAAAGFDLDQQILVDDGSSDATVEIARRLGICVVAIEKSKGAAAARNLAAAEVRSDADILFFVDQDVVVHPDVRERIRANFSNPDIAAVFGAYDTTPSCPGLVSQYRNLLHCYVHRNAPARPKSFWTGCGAVRSEAFWLAGGFDPNLRMMEDVDFGMRLGRLGYAIALDPSLQGKHLKTWKLRDMIRCDVCDRAVPWCKLMLAGEGLTDELNLGLSHRISAALVGFFVFSLIAAFIAPLMLWVSFAALLAFVAVNARFLGFLRRHAGWQVALAAIPLHMVHYGCAIAGLSWVLLTVSLPQSLGLKSRPEVRGPTIRN